MTPLIISAMTFVAVSSLIGLLAFVFVDRGGGTRMVNRLETLTGRRRKESEQANILKKQAIEQDKKSLLENFVPHLPSLQKIMVQADCNIKPSTLFGMGFVLGVMTATAAGWPA